MLSACSMRALVVHATGFTYFGYVVAQWHNENGGIDANFFVHFNFKVKKVLKSL